MQLRYQFRLYPTACQQAALTKTFGCARVVFNDGIRARELARAAGEPYIPDTELQSRLTVAEKAQRYGRHVGVVGRFEPTSQMCSACGHRDGPKPLHVRAWSCENCGAQHDRDRNAAKNILAAGRAGSLNACGGDIRPRFVGAVASETGTHPTPHPTTARQAGIPVP